MTPVNPLPIVPREHEIQIRVRYQETDGQGRVHHTNYINYFEVARVEMLRASGKNYRELESEGIMLVVTKVNCEYFRGALYDDLLTIKTTVTKAKGVRIHHHYEVYSEDELVARGDTVVAAVDPTGKVTRLPDWLQIQKSK
jgi:acyl-CoA thioester hydrolase